MANEKFLKGRFQQKTDTEKNWEKAKNFIPLDGEIIVYKDIKRLKVGDGVTTVGELDFMNGEGSSDIGELTTSGGIIFNDVKNNDAGLNAAAFGSNTKAVGKNSLAIGEGSVANGAYSIAGGTADKSFVTNLIGPAADGFIDITPSKANGEMSISYGAGNIAHSPAANAIGAKNQGGFLGYYIYKIEADIGRLYLSTSQSNTSYNKPTLDLSSWVGCTATIINDELYPECGKIVAVEEISEAEDTNTIYTTVILDSNLPFEELAFPTIELPHMRSIIAIPPIETQEYSDKVFNTHRPTAIGEVELGFSSTAFGFDNIAAGTLSTTFGMHNTALGGESFVTGKNNTGSFASLVGGSNNKATGYTSFAAGRNNTISGHNSAAFGNDNTVSGHGSLASGYHGLNTKNYTTTEGNKTIASGSSAHAEGSGTTYLYATDENGNRLYDNETVQKVLTSQTDAINFWKTNKIQMAHGTNSHVEGKNNLVNGTNSHAEGENNIVTGKDAHAEGHNNVAEGAGSHVEGGNLNNAGAVLADWILEDGTVIQGNVASGHGSHAEGAQTYASGWAAHAEGRKTIASYTGAHAEGNGTTASGNASHAEGTNTKASKQATHAEGFNTTAASNYQHVQGKYNIEDASNKYAHIVGNGDSTTPSNAHTLDWDGNAWFQGNVYVGGDNQDNGNRLATESYVDEEIATFDFIKVVDKLPEAGLPNRFYLVPKTESETQDLFDEYVWVNGAWEYTATKQLEVDLIDYVKKTDYAQAGKAGLVDVNPTDFGIGAYPHNGVLYITPADKAQIDKKTHARRPIVPSNLDYAVKAGITTNTETLTDEEKAAACNWMGAVEKMGAGSGWRVYGVQTDGTPYAFPIVNAATAATLPWRGTNGTVIVGEPTANNHATTKAYVDGLVGDIEAALDGIIAIQNELIGGAEA